MKVGTQALIWVAHTADNILWPTPTLANCFQTTMPLTVAVVDVEMTYSTSVDACDRNVLQKDGNL